MKAYRVNKFISPSIMEKYQKKSSVIRWYFYRRLDMALVLGEITKSDTILEIGAGRGFFLPSLALGGNSIIASDLAVIGRIKPGNKHKWAKKPQLHWAKELLKMELGSPYAFGKVSFCYANGAYLPFKDSTIDIVFVLDCLEHMSYQIKVSCLAEIRRVLRTGGRFICTLPNEKGLALLLRNLIGRITGFQRQHMGFREAVTALLRNRPIGEWGGEHTGYDYLEDIDLIGSKFRLERITYVPLPFLFGANPTIAVKAVKES